MLCRRCGMESATTDVCEWCKRPMLPQGASISQQAADQQAADQQGAEQVAAEERAGEQVEVVQPEEAPEQAAGAEALSAEPEAVAREREGAAEADEASMLRPLGGVQKTPSPGAPAPGVPTHGLGDEATQTSVDLSQYSGTDESIFRPIERPETTGTIGGADPLGIRRRGQGEMKTVSDIPENTRLMRSVAAGVIVCATFALVQMIVSLTVEDHPSVPDSLVFGAFPLIRSLGSSGSIVTVLLYGVLVGIIMGLMLGALLVRLKRGPFVGLLVGLAVGYGLENPPWGMIAGAACGIAIGVIATRGLRQVINV